MIVHEEQQFKITVQQYISTLTRIAINLDKNCGDPLSFNFLKSYE